MFMKDAPRNCRVVKRITEEHGAECCLKLATVVLHLHVPDPVILCLDCARELAKEILDSVPGGKWDLERVLAEQSGRTAHD